MSAREKKKKKKLRVSPSHKNILITINIPICRSIGGAVGLHRQERWQKIPGKAKAVLNRSLANEQNRPGRAGSGALRDCPTGLDCSSITSRFISGLRGTFCLSLPRRPCFILERRRRQLQPVGFPGEKAAGVNVLTSRNPRFSRSTQNRLSHRHSAAVRRAFWVFLLFFLCETLFVAQNFSRSLLHCVKRKTFFGGSEKRWSNGFQS